MISVIIPVYNDADLLPRAIRSCLSQMVVQEIIVIDDGSTDNITQSLSEFQDSRLIVIRHSDGQNHGRSASRNLGIKQATSEWIAFCDADDYYLPERFTHLDLKPDDQVDGYYDAIKTEYANPELSKRYPEKLTTLSKHIRPHKLGDYLISNREERISILGLVIRKKSLINIGLFDSNLMTGEDTDLIWRLSLNSQLHNTNYNQAVAARWIDGNNTYLDKKQSDIDRYHFYNKWQREISNYNLSTAAVKRVKDSYRYYMVEGRFKDWPGWCRWILRLFV